MASSDPQMEEVEGVFLFEEIVQRALGKSLKEHAKEVKAMDLREDDIFICSFPKSGSHWLWGIINVLLTGSIQKKQKTTTLIDLIPAENISSLPSPRVLSTHFPPHLLPSAIFDKKPKIVCLYRNPKDVSISAYFFYKSGFVGDDANVNTFIDEFPKSKYPYNFFRYLREFNNFIEQNRELPTLEITYESLFHDAKLQARRLAEFLELDCSEEKIAQAVEWCSFENMKKLDENFKENVIHNITGGMAATIYRKGTVGDWKTYFTVAESETYDKIIKQELDDTRIQFQFE